jgi:Bap31/Bap29 transmembrane region
MGPPVYHSLCRAGVTFALSAALMESITTLQRLKGRDRHHVGGVPVDGDVFSERVRYADVSLDKQRITRAERNLYLAGFALTLLFVIARIVELMVDAAVVEDERDAAKKRLDDAGSFGSTSDIPLQDGARSESSLRQRPGAPTSKSD